MLWFFFSGFKRWPPTRQRAEADVYCLPMGTVRSKRRMVNFHLHLSRAINLRQLSPLSKGHSRCSKIGDTASCCLPPLIQLSSSYGLVQYQSFIWACPCPSTVLPQGDSLLTMVVTFLDYEPEHLNSIPA